MDREKAVLPLKGCLGICCSAAHGDLNPLQPCLWLKTVGFVALCASIIHVPLRLRLFDAFWHTRPCRASFCSVSL